MTAASTGFDARGRRASPGPERNVTAANLRQRLEAALARRAALLSDPQTTVARLVHGAADGLTGLVIERLGAVLIAQLHPGPGALPEVAAHELCVAAAESVGATAVYRKVFPPDRSRLPAEAAAAHQSPTPWWGTPAPPEYPVREAGLTYLVRPYDGLATGLFLDHRVNRARVRRLAAGRCVLNAFAYTGAHSVCAAAGGARVIYTLDISRKALAWARANLAANALPPAEHHFVCEDAAAFCRRAARRGQRFELVILDPPTFARTRRPTRVFQIQRDLPDLVAAALPLVARDGHLLLSINHRATPARRLAKIVRTAARELGRRVRVEPVPLPEDFAGDPEYAKTVSVELS